MSDTEWRAGFWTLARHLPGFGGLASFDELTREDVRELQKLIQAGLEREAAALKR